MAAKYMMSLWVKTGFESHAQTVIIDLAKRGLCVNPLTTPDLNHRFLRQHPQLALLFDECGLWLAADGMKMQPDWAGQLSRLKRATVKNELIARACHISTSPRIIDATAGLGHDALLLAWLGADVTLIERHPVVFSLLQHAFDQAQQHAQLAECTQRIQLVHADAEHYLAALARGAVDLVYLDPMFPPRDQQPKKQALVKKEMQLFHRLFSMQAGEADLGNTLLAIAAQKAKRVVVKRPRHAQPLADVVPDHQWEGDSCRFDAYFF